MYEIGHFKGKKITVMGLGLLGRGIGDVRFLSEEGAELIVTDLKSRKELMPSLQQLKDCRNITYVLGEHRLEDFNDKDFILKAASVPLDSAYIREAEKNNIPIEMSSALFASLTSATVIGVTGTRGKSTVTCMLYEVLERAAGIQGPLYGKRIFLGGNIRGIATLNLLREAKAGDIAVLELDSWQLQGFGYRKISPHVSVFTNFFPDHLNYYKGNMDLYFADKANIFRYQKPGDTLVIGEQAEAVMHDRASYGGSSKRLVARVKDIPHDWNIKIPGEHNLDNASAVLATVRALGVSDAVTKTVFENFAGIPGRLELVREKNGVSIYNDTNATTPEATLAGLRALGTTNKVVLIMGGSDKQLDMSKLVSEAGTHAKRIILLAGSGSDRISADLEQSGISLVKAKSLKEAVALALEGALKGDVILFSPAFASFGMFLNEYDRGERFVEIIQKI